MKHQFRSYEPIENYGIIGDLKTVALVSLNGSIDFMSFPRFDSPTIFASILDAKQGGFFSIEPQMGTYKNKQLYIPGTAVLLTRFFSEMGIAEIIDFMPLDADDKDAVSTIVRKVKAVRGDITFKMHCAPRFNYARNEHTAEISDNQIIFTALNDGNSKLRLIADVPLQVNENDGYAEFTVKESGVVHIVLESVEAGKEDAFHNINHYTQNTYQQTIGNWRKWISKSTYNGRWSELVYRSAITLKLLTSHKYGSVVAAATFGLPEAIGGNRNWDYRYTWVRDAAFTMYAFLRLGFFEEATEFLNWIFDVSKDNHLQLIYAVDGNTDLHEKELDHLEGYKNSKPVRVGNAARDQLQVDIYGELIDTIYIYNKSFKPITYEFWTVVSQYVQVVIDSWQEPDHGIWEIRNEKKAFLHTRLMCWVAMDRAIKIAEHRSFPFPETEWKKVRDDIYMDIYHNFWNEDIKAWVQYKGAQVVDASVLLMPLVHFISPIEPRWLSTMEVIDDKLRLDVLIYRYHNAIEKIDGLDGEEGTFNMCSFWFIEALAKAGQIERAVENFEKMRGYANHLGLFSEELGKQGEHLGNFPQAFTHLALISAALELDKQISRF
ncbi:glycoside hydrolase family 15 protein [Mucilaginibacter sp. Bleaf8]|uniref:glycoside hydrolase family 15 protein n=1 Tax=Mucilaginibacter sp. Bleaf8 TaxID=2834430 RepID=UPI001BCD2F0F|nr:glycoside hydrolase family 15 protein [Mucilaginibacter sp. Bleaf8]MBS7563273.1 glycoside hydrolase family 15 protein [Mucilaginibacter sp. Bleaf8]